MFIALTKIKITKNNKNDFVQNWTSFDTCIHNSMLQEGNPDLV